jgi:hypothetical protein
VPLKISFLGFSEEPLNLEAMPIGVTKANPPQRVK